MVMPDLLPVTYIFVHLWMDEDIMAGAYNDYMVKVAYTNTGETFNYTSSDNGRRLSEIYDVYGQ